MLIRWPGVGHLQDLCAGWDRIVDYCRVEFQLFVSYQHLMQVMLVY
ncbi:hypothetical protein MishRS11D_46030 (plasmid) [Methylomagnum ishizawai]|nr:hypothetical protein MishRS11D_46030 [Methylomagnum ishizawai]